MARALEELIDSTRSVCEEPTKFIENKLCDTLKALKPASETWFFLKDALVLQGAKAKQSTVKLGKDRFEVIAIHDKHGDVVKDYSFVELPEGETVTLADFEGLLKDGVFEFGCSESKPKTYFKNFLAEVKNARKQDVTREFKQDLDNSLLSMYVPFAAATGRKNFSRFVDLLQEHEPDLYDSLKAACNIKFNSPESIANKLYDNLTEQAKQILSEERKEHKKEISEIVNSPAYTKIANFTKNVVANGLIWTPLLAIIAGMAGLTVIAPHVAADNSPEKTSSRNTNQPTQITNESGIESLWGWSPDGKKIIYSSQGDLYTVNPDGTNTKKIVDLANEVGLATYSSDGTKIAFAERDSNNITRTLYIMNSDGTNMQKICDNAIQFRWSTSSNRLAFYGQINDTLAAWVMDLRDNSLFKFSNNARVIAWNTDNQFAFEEHAYSSTTDYGTNIYIAYSDGTNNYGSYRIANESVPNREIGFDIFWVGKYVYYSSFGNIIKSSTPDEKIGVASLDGTISSMSLSPDESKIAVYLIKDSDCSIYVLNTDGSHVKKMASGLSSVPNVASTPQPGWNSNSDLLEFSTIDSNLVNAKTYVTKANQGAPTKVIDGAAISGMGEKPAIWSPHANSLAFSNGNNIYVLNINSNDIGWTSSQLEKIQKYAPVIIHDDRRDTSATQLYAPSDPHGDNADVQDNHENYDASPLKFSNGSMEPVYVKITEYPAAGFDIYTYIYYRAENPHWIGLEAFKHEHDVQRVHVKVDRISGKAIEVAYSQHDWMVKQKVNDNSDLTFYSEWGGHEYWKFSWFGADGKGQKLASTNTEFRPLDEIVSGLDADKDGKYKTNEKNLPTSSPPKVPWLDSDVKDPQTAFGTSNAKGVFMADLHSPGDLSVIINNVVTDKNQTNIPNSAWQNNSIGIIGASITDNVTLKVVGTENSSYSLSGVLAADKPYTLNGAGIPITKGEIHTYSILNWGNLADGKASINWTIQKTGKTYSRVVKASELTKATYDDITKEQPKPHPIVNPSADNTLFMAGVGTGIGIGIGVSGYMSMRKRRRQPPAQPQQVQPTHQQEIQQQTQPSQDLYANDYAVREQQPYQQESWQPAQEPEISAVKAKPVPKSESIDDILKKLKEN